jgi:NTP pyrophosphatase (non-canonical NTP hydrolase)
MIERSETEPRNRIRTFRELQNVQEHFSFQNGLENTNTPHRVLIFLYDEVYECCEALDTQDQLQIKGEVSDIFIFAATLANVLHFDVDQAIRITGASHGLNLQGVMDIELSRLQGMRAATHPMISRRLSNQECINSIVQVDRAQQAYTSGQKDRMLAAVGELILATTDISNRWNIDIEEAVTQKIERNFAKYNPFIARELMESGLTPLEAYITQKNQWDRNRDYDFLR